MADANVIGGIPVLHRVAVADGATADVDVVLTHKTLVTDVWLVKTGGAGGANDTITVKNGANVITDAMDIKRAPQGCRACGYHRRRTTPDRSRWYAARDAQRRWLRPTWRAPFLYVLGVRVA